MPLKKIAFLVFFLSFFCCCFLFPSNNIVDERPLSTVFDNLICEPPCWGDISPGLTTYKEALEIIEKLPVTEVTESTVGIEKRKRILFQPYDQKTNQYTEVIEIIFSVDEVVDTIYISSAGARITAPYVFSRLGEPDLAVQSNWGPRLGLVIMRYPNRGIEVNCLPDCTTESDVFVTLYPLEDYEERLIREYGSPERAEYAQQFFCPWVGVDASYLFVDWGPFNYPEEYPTVPPTEIKSQCPTGE